MLLIPLCSQPDASLKKAWYTAYSRGTGLMAIIFSGTCSRNYTVEKN